jgi:hypothetical protein
MQEKFLDAPIEGTDINATLFWVTTLDMEEKVATVGEELRPTMRFLDGVQFRD